jgi:hypothetical protein
MDAVRSLIPETDLNSLSLGLIDSRSYYNGVQQLLPSLGSFEYGKADFKLAITFLNDFAKMGLDNTEAKAISLILTALAENTRFKDDFHINLKLGENAAVHSCQCIPLGIEILRRADLWHDEDMIDTRVILCIGFLLHDMGEMLGEFTSLAQRSLNTDLHIVPETERKIFIIAMRLALHAVENNTPEDFFIIVGELKAKAKVGPESFGNLKELEALLDDFSEKHVLNLKLSPNSEFSFGRMLRIFDIADLNKAVGLSNEELFIGYSLKVIEHFQGTRHLLLLAHREDGHTRIPYFNSLTTNPLSLRLPAGIADFQLPLSMSPSLRVFKNLEFSEYGIGEMFEAALSSPFNSKQMRLARQIRDGAYESVVELLSLSAPVINRKSTYIDPALHAGFQKIAEGNLSTDGKLKILANIKQRALKEVRDNLKTYRDLRKNTPRHLIDHLLLPVETEMRLSAVYKNAIDNDYIPRPGEILGTHDVLPPGLAPLGNPAWHTHLKDKIKLQRRNFI